MNRSSRDELTIGIRLGFWGLTLLVAYMGYCLLLAIFEPAAGLWSWMLAISGLLTLVLGSVVAVLGAYRLSRALGYKMVERIVYGVLMLLPFANFILLWMLRDRGVLKRDELHLRDLAQESLDAPRPAPALEELVSAATAKPEAHAVLGRFTRGTLWTLGISGGLSGGLLAVFLVTRRVLPCAGGSSCGVSMRPDGRGANQDGDRGVLGFTAGAEDTEAGGDKLCEDGESAALA